MRVESGGEDVKGLLKEERSTLLRINLVEGRWDERKAELKRLVELTGSSVFMYICVPRWNSHIPQ